MARKSKLGSGISEYLAEIGRKGGQARVLKGVASLSPSERKRIAASALKARWDAYYTAHPEKLKAKQERDAKKGTVKRGRPAKKGKGMK